MSDKDYYEKKLEDFNDVFADIINVLLFGGRDIIQENDLQTGMSRSSYRVEGKIEEQERDAKKFWMNGQIRIAVFGLENQTGEDKEFPVRGIAYDGAEYRDQLRLRSDIRKENRKRKEKSEINGNMPKLLPVPDFYPVVTLVLYFGDARWNGSLNLKDHLNIPPELEKFVSDYRINLREISFLDEETVSKFKSDFRYVAEYFVQNRRAKEGLEPKFTLTIDHIKHVNEFMELMNALTNSKKFSDLPERIAERSEDVMLTYLFDEAEARGISIGEARGEGMFAQLTKYLLSSKKYDELSKASDDPDYRKQLYKEYGIDVEFQHA